MKVTPFPGAADGRAAGEQIDAMLAGEVGGAESLALRRLREDVRALAAPVTDEFERELQSRVAGWEREAGARRRGPRFRAGALRARMRGTPRRLLALGGAASAVASVLLVLAFQGGGGGTARDLAAHERAATNGPAGAAGTTAARAHRDAKVQAEEAAAPPPEAGGAPDAGGSAAAEPALGPAAPARLQQLGASATLAARGPEGVQEAADAVTRLAASDGGYVESSHVQVRQSGGASEAQLRLSIPSAKLAAAIAALGRIAPLRAVSQESQDITSSYEAAKRALRDDEAVRRALLRALAGATTEGQIASLRERLSSNRDALARDRVRLRSVAHTAATSQLEVSITSTGAAAAGQGTLGRGLHDAGHVLAVSGALALVALAVLVPLAALALVLGVLRRAWLRRRREAALEG